MIKRVKELRPNAPIGTEPYRAYVENFESEILRGINTLVILRVIEQHGPEGSYGYQILKDLEDQTNKLLVIEEGTLYPILRKLEKEGMLASTKREAAGRERKYYMLTTDGKRIYYHMMGFTAKLIEAIAPMADMRVMLDHRFYYCPNCANKIDLSTGTALTCDVCGLTIEVPTQKLNQTKETNQDA
jgi:PadR family transcriptional regulator PadR